MQSTVIMGHKIELAQSNNIISHYEFERYYCGYPYV